MPSIKGNGLGLLVVLIAFFTITAISLTTIATSQAEALPQFSDTIQQAANNLWIIAIVLIAILVTVVVFQARGSASFGW